MKQPEAELTELTKCERYARKMICQSQSERVELDLGKDILAQLETRKMELNNMAELGEREPKSAPKIRKRSISLAKLGMSNDILKNRKPQ